MAGPRQGLSLTDLDGDDDVLYGGGGDDLIDATEQPFKDMHRDKLYCGEGEAHYIADKLDYVDSSCEVKNPPSNI
jgi:hypothetical protein